MGTITTWEIKRDSKPGIVLSSEPGKDDFQSRAEAEAYARTIGFAIVREVICSLNEDGEADGNEFYKEIDHEIKGIKLNKEKPGAHAFCVQCKARKHFKTGVEAYDWQFLHELQHGASTVETWETEIGRPGERFPLRRTVSVGKLSVTVLLDGTQVESATALLNDLCAIPTDDED